MPVATITNRIISSAASRVLNPVTIRMPPTNSTVAPITAHTDDCGTPRPARVAANAPSAMSFCRPLLTKMAPSATRPRSRITSSRTGAPDWFCISIACPFACGSWLNIALARQDEIVQVALEAFARLRRSGVEREVRVVDIVHIRRAKRPGAALCRGGRSDVNRRKHAGREQLVLEHVAGAPLLEGDERLARGVRDRRELLAAPDPGVARVVDPARVKQGDVGRYRFYVENRVVLAGEGLVQHFPVVSVFC